MNKKFKASSIRLKATFDKGKDKHFELELDHLTKFGSVIITMKAYHIKPDMALITFWDQSFLFGSVISKIGDFGVYKTFDLVIYTYFKSPEFEQRRKEAGKCN